LQYNKMQIPSISVCIYIILHKVCFAAIGVCVFYASASVGAFFNWKEKLLCRITKACISICLIQLPTQSKYLARLKKERRKCISPHARTMKKRTSNLYLW